MREVDDARDAEDEREANGNKEKRRRRRQTVERLDEEGGQHALTIAGSGLAARAQRGVVPSLATRRHSREGGNPARSPREASTSWFATHRFRLWASHFLLLRQKKVTKEEATPEIVLFLRCSEKSGTKKTRFAQTVFRSDRFCPPLLGANQRGPIEPILDRFAMEFTAAERANVGGAC